MKFLKGRNPIELFGSKREMGISWFEGLFHNWIETVLLSWIWIQFYFLLLGHVDLLGKVALHSNGVLVFKFKGWPSLCCPECPSDRFLLLCSFYRNILFKEPRKQFRAGARSSSYFFEENPFLHSQTMSKWIKKNGTPFHEIFVYVDH